MGSRNSKGTIRVSKSIRYLDCAIADTQVVKLVMQYVNCRRKSIKGTKDLSALHFTIAPMYNDIKIKSAMKIFVRI